MKNNNLISPRSLSFKAQEQGYSATFHAMASPCEILIQTTELNLVKKITKLVSDEVWRIEDKYSRYNKDSVCSHINNSAGQCITIDEETYLLLIFAQQCYQLSGGLFDISAGILNQIWYFDGSENIATSADIARILPFVGWDKIVLQPNSITLPAGMALDFGGFGKEYAVDRAILLSKQITALPVLVNLGGDLAVSGPRLGDKAWQVAIEAPEENDRASVTDQINTDQRNTEQVSTKQDIIVALHHGALATSGDSKRYLAKKGKRYSHVLNALTGWPIEQAPRSITALAPQCIQAGMLATLALLQGQNAEQFLSEQAVTYWARR
ncbi:FAD:protein FMN transferase [Colwellia piezophila]|uniref:FAD:protein FMN transferase n=1 Tax=Colwellia piezophila TaxID=211668 RepID=UPI00035D98A9|nr:FAD:protein FMN transferase [Colwellia piezophila]